MAYASQQLYLTWGGTLGATGTSEIWQCGIHLAPIVAGGVVGPPNQAQADAARTLLGLYHGGDQLPICNAARLDWVKIAHLDLAGDYLSDPVVSETPAGTGVQGSKTPGGGPQLAVAVTLASGSSFGKANYGRFYLPWSLPATDATGRYPSNEATGIAQQTVSMLSDMQALIEANKTSGGILDVTNMSSVGGGTNKRVLEVRVGRVVDTQRRRRNRINEAPVVVSR